MNKKLFAMFTLSLAVACTSLQFVMAEEDNADVAEFTQLSENSSEIAAIGKKAEGDYEVLIKNATGKAIKGLSIDIDSEGKGEDLLKDQEAFAKDEERMLYVTPKETDPSAKDFKPPVYDLELTFEDDTTVVLHTFPFGDVKEAEIRLQDGVGYLIFESLSLKAEQNTLSHEKNLAGASAGAVEYTQDGSTDVYNYYYDYGTDEDYSYDYSYGNSDYDTSYYEEQSGSSDTSGDSGDSTGSGDDSCLDDGLILN